MLGALPKKQDILEYPFRRWGQIQWADSFSLSLSWCPLYYDLEHYTDSNYQIAGHDIIEWEQKERGREKKVRKERDVT